MSRPFRLEFAGALYHVTSRGNRKEDIYESDADRHLFLNTLGSVCTTKNWVCHAYCLMSNDYHLLIETPDANLLTEFINWFFMQMEIYAPIGVQNTISSLTVSKIE